MMNKPSSQTAGTPDPRAVKYRLKYEELSSRYASQAVIKATPEEIQLDFTSGVIPDPTTGDQIVPVHSRITMTPAGARRFIQALQQALQGASGQAQATGQAAGLPPLEVES